MFHRMIASQDLRSARSGHVVMVVLAVVAFCGAPTAIADTVILSQTFTGVVTGGYTIDVQGYFGSPLTSILGDPYTAVYTETLGSSGFPISPTTAAITINGHTYTEPPDATAYSMSSSGISDSAGGLQSAVNWVIPKDTLDLGAFIYNFNTATDSSNSFLNLASLDGGLDPTLGVTSVQVVPLPPAAWLLLSGIGGLAIFSSRRKAVAEASRPHQ